MLGVALGRFGDVDRQIADPFEVGVDLDRAHHRPQIRRHRLVQRQQLQHPVVDLDVQLVHRLVAAQHGVDQPVVALRQRLHGMADPLLGEATHLEQPGLEDLELFLKMSDDAFHGAVSP